MPNAFLQLTWEKETEPMPAAVKPRSAPKTLDLVYIAVGAALIAVSAWVSIPLTVPVTMQTFAVFFVLSLLGGKRGTLSVLVYILLGAVGAPVFTGFKAGPGVLLGSTGGYIAGFVLTGLLFWLAEKTFPDRLPFAAGALILGLFLCYAFGTAWFWAVYNRNTGAATLPQVLSWCVLPFLVPDLLKLAAALALSRRLKPLIKLG